MPTFGPLTVVDPRTAQPIPGRVAQVVDATTGDPVATYDTDGNPRPVVTGTRGQVGQFVADAALIDLLIPGGDPVRLTAVELLGQVGEVHATMTTGRLSPESLKGTIAAEVPAPARQAAMEYLSEDPAVVDQAAQRAGQIVTDPIVAPLVDDTTTDTGAAIATRYENLVPVTRFGVFPSPDNRDQSAGIQAAIDSGLPIYFPPGRYVASGLVAKRGMHLVGAGKGHPDEPGSPRSFIRTINGDLFTTPPDVSVSAAIIENIELQGFGDNAGDIITGWWSMGAFRSVRILQYRPDRHCFNVTGWLDMVIEGMSEIMTQPSSTVPAFKATSNSGRVAQFAFRDVRFKGGGGNALSPHVWLEATQGSLSGITNVTFDNVNFEIPHAGCIRLLSCRSVYIKGCGAWDLDEAANANMIYIGKSPSSPDSKASGQIVIEGWMRDATTPPNGMDIKAEESTFDLDIIAPGHQTGESFRIDAGGARGRISGGKSVTLYNAQNMSTDKYQLYTPTVSPTVLGDGTLTGRYKREGDHVHVQINFIVGSTTNVGDMNFSLPIPAAAGFPATATARDVDAGKYYSLGGRISSSLVSLARIGADGQLSTITGSLPFPWAANDTVSIDLHYRAA